MINQVSELNWNYIGGNRLIQNPIIKGQNNKSKVFSFEPYAQQLFDLITDQKRIVIKKDLQIEDIVNIIDVIKDNQESVYVEIEGGLTIQVDMSREKKLCQAFGYEDIKEFVNIISDPFNKKTILNTGLKAKVTNIDPVKISLWDGHMIKIHDEFKDQIKKPSKAYIAKITEANKGGYFVQVQGMNAFMPGSLAAANKINNFRDFIGKEVIVMIEDYMKDMKSFIVSHKKYIEYVLPTKIKELDLNKRYVGTVTGTSKYGIFVEFEDIFTGLLHTSKMKSDTLENFKNRIFKSEDQIGFYINEVTKDNRIILTEESLEERNKKVDEFLTINKDKIISASISAIMEFGVIVNFDDISGLVPIKEFKRKQINVKNLNIKDSIFVILCEIKDDKIIFNLPRS